MLPKYDRLLLVLLFATVPAILCAQPAELVVPRISAPPSIDRFLGADPAAGRVEGFTQREPGDGVPVSQSTVAYVSYDEDRLYVVFVCGERSADGVRARLAAREAITADDQVGVLLDTFHDRRRAYFFASNPMGIQTDALLTEGQPDDYSFDTVWYSSGRLTDDGFVVSIAIPFKSLRVPPSQQQEWGIALVRIIPRNSERSYWPSITGRVEGLAQQFATLKGLSNISPGRNLQLIPYVTGAAATIRDEKGRMIDDQEARAGVDAKVVIHDALTLDVVINPDFSQVESDQPQVITNQRFEVFFPEKRPFFIENAGYFLYGAVPAARSVPETLFFSRRIVDPQVGVRLTGKMGRWAVGGLAIDDRIRSATTQNRESAAAGVLRLQREIGAQSSVGVLASTHTADGRENRISALDGRIKLGANWVISALMAASDTTSAGQHLSGSAVNVNVNHTSRRVLYNVFYSDRSPSFRADVGFVPRTDIRQIEQYIEYRWRPVNNPVLAIGPNSYFRFNWDRQGKLQEWIVRFPFQVDLKGRTSIFVRRVEYGELFRGLRFREHLQTVNVQTEWLKWLVVNESIEGGRSVNFFPAAGMSPTSASFLTASLSMSFRPTPQFRADATYLLNRLGAIPSAAERGGSIFDNHVARATINYQFTRTLSLRAILDYRAVLPNPALVALNRDKKLTGDLLLTYLVQPGTALYFGYTAGFDNVANGDTERESPLLGPASRQLFLKASYLVRF